MDGHMLQLQPLLRAVPCQQSTWDMLFIKLQLTYVGRLLTVLLDLFYNYYPSILQW